MPENNDFQDRRILPRTLLALLHGLQVRDELVGVPADGGGAQVAGLAGDAGDRGPGLVVADGGFLRIQGVTRI